MIYRCKNCGGALEYSVEKDRMVCDYCKSEFRVSELSQDSDPESSQNNTKSKKYIKMQIVRCTACGAELAVNGVEASTFCAYCGQASVIQDRVDNVLKPDYIIPFKVTKEEAEGIIRKNLKKGFFVPKAIKNFEAEKIRGIYVPFWLFDIRYKDFQYWMYFLKKKRKDYSNVRFEYVEAEAFFKRLTLDASYKFDDDSSVRLEPYDMGQLREFDMAYLSGYYSDRYDMKEDSARKKALSRVREYFDELVQKGMKHKDGVKHKAWPVYRVTKTDYALLPAWFLTFKYDDKPYTILVNGQTGKMVGAVPAAKAKVYSMFLIAASILFGIGMLVFPAITKFFLLGSKPEFKPLSFIVAFLAGFINIAKSTYDKYKKSISLTTARGINQYMKERQDRYK